MATKGNYIFALDIGSSYVRSVIGEVIPNLPPQVIGVNTTEAHGIRKGQIFDHEDAVESINENLQEVERKIGEKPGTFITSIGGPHIQSITSRGVVAVSRADGEISEEDIIRVIKAAEAISLPKNKELLHIIPKEFIVDKETGIRDPRGMHGVRLEVECEVVFGSTSAINSLMKSIEEAGNNVEGLVFSTLAAAEAVLSKRQKELGVLVLDIGGSSAGLCVFEEGNIFATSVLPIGASHVSNDIAIAFQIPIEVAEKVKLKYGIACSGEYTKKEEINLKDFGEEKDKRISRKKLVEVIEARNSEILDLANKELKKMGRERLLPGGVVIVGGGAKMPGMEEFVKKELHLPCQIGFPTKVEGVVDKIDDPAFATVVGLLLWEFNEKSGAKGSSRKIQFGKKFSKMKKWVEGMLP